MGNVKLRCIEKSTYSTVQCRVKVQGDSDGEGSRLEKIAIKGVGG